MTKTPTIHNPTNFDPADYEILDYLDGKRPQYYGQGIEAFENDVKFWEAEMVQAFGADWRQKKVTTCVHCGHNPLRWLTVTKHVPSGSTVVFGADCTKRLEFMDKFTFKLAQLQARDAANKVRIKVWNQREAFLKANPTFAEAVADIDNPIHAKNFFAKDVYAKLGLYGSLSERQVNAVMASLKRDVTMVAVKAADATEVKGPAPSGRQTVTGTVLSTKVQASDFGPVTKMLVKLDNNSRVWLTAPSKADITRNGKIVVTATFTVSKDDASFAFGSRPSLVKFEAAAV